MSEKDQVELTRRIEALGDIVAIVPPLPDTMVRAVPVSTVYRWKPGEYDALMFRSVDYKKLAFRYISSEYGYAVDEDRSPVISYWRCIMTNDYIQRGRVYYVPNYFDDDGRKIMKSDEFIAAAQKIFKIVRKMCVERRDFFYISENAQVLEKCGYKLITT